MLMQKLVKLQQKFLYENITYLTLIEPQQLRCLSSNIQVITKNWEADKVLQPSPIPGRL